MRYRNPTGFHLTPGQAQDLTGADKLLPQLKAEALLADKAYDAGERVLERLEQQGCQAVIPPKSNRVAPREYDRELYKARHLIENFFAKLKRTRVRNLVPHRELSVQYRALATRYDKTARNFLAAIHLAASVIWLN